MTNSSQSPHCHSVFLTMCVWPLFPWRSPPVLQVLTSEVSDWRKNVEAMSGMEGRKKMFDAAGGGQWVAPDPGTRDGWKLWKIW